MGRSPCSDGGVPLEAVRTVAARTVPRAASDRSGRHLAHRRALGDGHAEPLHGRRQALNSFAGWIRAQCAVQRPRSNSPTPSRRSCAGGRAPSLELPVAIFGYARPSLRPGRARARRTRGLLRRCPRRSPPARDADRIVHRRLTSRAAGPAPPRARGCAPSPRGARRSGRTASRRCVPTLRSRRTRAPAAPPRAPAGALQVVGGPEAGEAGAHDADVSPAVTRQRRAARRDGGARVPEGDVAVAAGQAHSPTAALRPTAALWS